MTLSRAGTFTFQSPPSSASAQTSVAGSVARHSKSRGPVGTPCDRHAIRERQRRERARPSRRRGPRPRRRARKRSYVVTYEYGLWIDVDEEVLAVGRGVDVA